MRAALTTFCLTLSVAASAASSRVGNLILVDDPTGSAHTLGLSIGGFGADFCAYAARGLYAFQPDNYDMVISFTTHQMTELQWQLNAVTPTGTAVRSTETGVSFGSNFYPLQPSAFGSAAMLKHCVYMGPLRMLPPPDQQYFLAPPPGGGPNPSGELGIEVMGHELGHYWLMKGAYDKADGKGLQALFRSDTRDNPDQNPVSAAQLHYSHLADSHSVMYGNWLTPLGGNSYRLSGGKRGYGPLDQYLMGLRSPQDTPPLLVLDDGSQRGLIGVPLMAGQTQTVTGRPVQISVDDIVRAQGPRLPAFPNSKRCWKIAFVLVTHQGHLATPAEVAQIEAYRTRLVDWFSEATEGRAAVVTDLDATVCPEPPLDQVDAGRPAPDAGEMEVDAGETIDAGEEVDAGEVADAGEEPMQPEEPRPDGGKFVAPVNTYRPGCSCNEAPVVGVVLALAALLRARRRRQ